MQQSIEAFVADMSAQLDSVDNGFRDADQSSDVFALRRVLYLLQSLRETLDDENPKRRRDASAVLMAEFQQSMAAMFGGLAKARLPALTAPRGPTIRTEEFSEGEVVPFDPARRRARTARQKAETSSADHLAERIADPHFSRPSDDELADVREQINAIVVRRRSLQAGQDTSDPLHPVGMAWRMLPGIIRNLEQQLGKSISFVTSGDRIEVNRSLIDAVRVPLIYLTRNAADHGLETAQERLASGKSPVGTIRISVARDADDVVVELSDDGRGLDAAKMAKLAAAGFIAEDDGVGRSSGIGTLDQADAAPRETQPALDRGIGLDAVRRHIELAGGSINLRSRPGCGVTAAIRMPTHDPRTSSTVSSSDERTVCMPNFPR